MGLKIPNELQIPEDKPPLWTDQDKEKVAIILLAVIPGIVAFVGSFPSVLTVAAVLVCAVGATFLRGANWMMRAYLFAPYALIALGIPIATNWYVQGRPWIINLEMAIPMALGSAPGLLLYFLLRRRISAT